MGWRDDLMAEYNAQTFVPAHMGLESGFSPLTDLGIESMADYTGVNTEKTDFENYLATLQGLPEANANWDQGLTALHGEVPWEVGQQAIQTPDGSSFFGAPEGYLGNNQWAGFNWRPQWSDIYGPVSDGGIGYNPFATGLEADPNYDPASISTDMGAFSGGDWDPDFGGGIKPSGGLFTMPENFLLSPM